MNRAVYLFALAAAGFFFLLGLRTLPQYGLTWDAPENLLSGTHYARFFASGHPAWLDFAAHDDLYRQAGDARPLLYNREFNAPFRYPPVANITAVVTHTLFTTHLGWLASIDGYHLAVLFFASLTIFVLACFTWQAFGPVASFAATLALSTYPLFVEHAHNNLKDVPFAALVMLALWAYWRGWQHGRWRWFVLSALAAGLGMGVRVLAVEVWPIAAIAFLPWAWANRRQGWALRPYVPLFVCIPLALLLFLAVWPWLWPDPSGHLSQHLAFGRDVSRGLRVLYNGQLYASGMTLPWHYTAVIFSLTTPLVVLGGGLVGSATIVTRSRWPDPAALMLLALFLLALIRTSWPGIPQYDGTRHMLDGIVALAGLFGVGFQAGWAWVQKRWPRPWPARLPYIIAIFLLLPTMVSDIRLHPYQGIYYNMLAGGPAGAFDRFPQEYWGSSFRLGMAWASQNADPEALILPRVGGHLARFYIKPGHQIIPDEAIGALPPDQPILIIYMTRRDKYDWIADFADAHLTAVYTLERGGVPVLKIVSTDAGRLQQARP